MQTFLPYADFGRSAAVLDQPRLGKQRVETLQILRALVVPDYGWQNHPATLMWMGHVPALVQYGLAMTDEWIRRGHADTVREQILEFAPHAAEAEVQLPPWLGEEAVHRSHRSNLIAKDEAFYAPRFPDTRGGDPYVWPAPARLERPAEPAEGLWVARARRKDPEAAAIRLPMLGAKGTPIGGKRGRQLMRFLEDMDDGDPVAVFLPGESSLLMGTAGPVRLTNDEAEREVRLTGQCLARTDFAYPALLQDPRTLFTVPAPAAGRPGRPA